MKYLLLSICVLFSSNAFTQKILQIEKYGRAKTKKIYIGEQVTYQLKGGNDWYSEILIDIKAEDQILVFTNRFVKVQDIVALKSYKNAKAARNLQYSLYSFAASWAFWSLGAAVAGESLEQNALTVPASSLVLGWSIRKLFYSRKIKLGKRRRLRALDIGFNNQMQYDFKN